MRRTIRSHPGCSRPSKSRFANCSANLLSNDPPAVREDGCSRDQEGKRSHGGFFPCVINTNESLFEGCDKLQIGSRQYTVMVPDRSVSASTSLPRFLRARPRARSASFSARRVLQCKLNRPFSAGRHRATRTARRRIWFAGAPIRHGRRLICAPLNREDLRARSAQCGHDRPFLTVVRTSVDACLMLKYLRAK
jgi:hypothetical protein